MASYPELNGLVVAITGAAQGIGAVTARLFAAQGTAVALLDIDAAGIDAVAADITRFGGKARAFATDITDSDSVTAAIAGTVAAFGGLDITVNSAGGYGRLATVEDMPVDEWDRTVALNLRVLSVLQGSHPAPQALAGGPDHQRGLDLRPHGARGLLPRLRRGQGRRHPAS